MALARWHDLCVDANDAVALGQFWGRVLGLDIQTRDDGVVMLRDPDGAAGLTLWVNPVPEPKSAKHRVHPDLRLDLDQVLASGAVVRREPDDEIGWHVCVDVEDGEFCVFRPLPDARTGLYELVVDCADPEAQAAWWADVFGATAAGDSDRPWRWVEDLSGAPFEYLVFTPVPEPKALKNRWHWDVMCDDVGGLLAKGATLLRRPDDEISWHVLADREGNEFCAFASS